MVKTRKLDRLSGFCYSATAFKGQPPMRSNTYPTQKAVYALSDFIQSMPFLSRSFSDTIAEVSFDDLSSEEVLSFTVCNRLIMQVRKKAGEILDVYVFSGFYYDFDGNPTRTVRERLNGLLDALGDKGIIPVGVRVIVDKEYSMCYVARGDNMVALNKDYCDMIGIKPCCDSLVFGALDPTRDQKKFKLVQFEKQEV